MKFGQVSLAATGSTVSGSITTDSGAIFQIIPASDGAGKAYVLERDQVSFPKEREPIRVKPSGTAADQGPGADNGSTIDVMVAYTAKAKAAAGGENGIITMIRIGIEQTNQGYVNSGVIQRVR